MSSPNHISADRIDDLSLGGQPTVEERQHVSACVACERLLDAHRSVNTALSGRWTWQGRQPARRAPARRWVTAAGSLLVSLVLISVAGLALFVSRPSPSGSISPVAEAPSLSAIPSAAGQSPLVSLSATATNALASVLPPSPGPSESIPSTPGPSVSHVPTGTSSSAPASAAIPTSGVIANVPGVDFEAWSPDGQHLVVRSASGIEVVDSTGAALASLASSTGHWTSATTLATFGSANDGSVKERVQFFDLSGNKVGEVPEDFQAVLFAPASSVFAGTIPTDGDAAVGATYRVWDGRNLSSILQGVPMAWSTDGSMAVLDPLRPSGNGAIDPYGTLRIVDATDATLFRLPGWVGSAYDPVIFSPDGAYLAACLAPADGSGPSRVQVIGVATQSVVSMSGACGVIGWSAGDALVASDGSAEPTLWTQSSGSRDAGCGGDAYATISSNGNIACWSGSDVHVVNGPVTTDFNMPDVVDGAAWSPDGSTIAVNWAGTLSIIQVE